MQSLNIFISGPPDTLHTGLLKFNTTITNTKRHVPNQVASVSLVMCPTLQSQDCLHTMSGFKPPSCNTTMHHRRDFTGRLSMSHFNVSTFRQTTHEGRIHKERALFSRVTRYVSRGKRKLKFLQSVLWDKKIHTQTQTREAAVRAHGRVTKAS